MHGYAPISAETARRAAFCAQPDSLVPVPYAPQDPASSPRDVYKRQVTHRDLVSILKELDRDLVVGALSGEHFAEYFYANCKDDAIAACVKELLA